MNADKLMKVEVVATKGLNKYSRSLRFKFVDKNDVKEFGFVPGQFLMVSVPGYGESALSITTSPSELPELEIAVKTVGNNTMALNRLNVGDTAYVRGPLGNGAPQNEIIGRQLILIAGGIGLVPLRSLIHTIRDDRTIVGKLTIVYGAKTPEDLVCKDELGKWTDFAEVHLTVDKADSGWRGETGNIVDLVKTLTIEKDAVAIVCGPPVIYKSIAKVLTDKGQSPESIEFMLERRMKCGIGKCQHCTCGDKYVCTDGPNFKWSDIQDNWEALV